MNMLDCFPSGFAPRQSQTQILREIESNLSKYDYFVINAPTGVGKSHIAYAVANFFKVRHQDSAIVTSTKLLQDQYAREFPDIQTIKGKSNFPCEYLIDIKHASPGKNWNIVDYRKRGLSCNYGPCDKARGNKNKTCSYKEDGNCSYYAQRDYGLQNIRVCMNYPLLFALKNAGANGTDRYAMIYDEAHNLEDQLVNWGTIVYTDQQMAELGLNVDLTKYNDVDETLVLIDKIGQKCGELAAKSNDLQIKMGYREMAQKASGIQEAISLDPVNFLIHSDVKGFKTSLRITPLKVGRIRERFLTGAKQFFLSATITKHIINQELGIPLNSIKEIQTREHPFPLENRKIQYLSTARITKSNFAKNPGDEEKCIMELQQIARKHPNERGLVLITRKSDLDLMRQWLDRDVVARFIEGHSTNKNNTDMNESIMKLKESRNGILVSSSAWEGIDLKDDLARWFVIYKMPWLDLGDKRINRMKDISQQWYGQKCMTKLIQGLGRCVRSNTDYAIGYCVDSGIPAGLKQNRRLIPIAYHDMF